MYGLRADLRGRGRSAREDQQGEHVTVRALDGSGQFMKVQHSFDLPEAVDQVWSLLSRIDEIAPCLPGATATRTDDDHFAGTLRVRMGPLDMAFKGTIEFVERNREAGRVVLRSKGSETRGQGAASATTVATL